MINLLKSKKSLKEKMMNDTLESISQEMYKKSYKELIYRVDGEVEGGERQRTVQLELSRRENAERKAKLDMIQALIDRHLTDNQYPSGTLNGIQEVLNGEELDD